MMVANDVPFFAERYMSSRRRREIVKRLYVLLALAVCGVVSWSVMISMPGKSFRGAPLPLLPPELILRDELAAHVQKLAGEIGERNMAHYSKLGVAADYIEASFAQAGFKTSQPRASSRKPIHRKWSPFIAAKARRT